MMSSLLNLSVNAIVASLDTNAENAETIQLLPNTLKSILLKVACNRRKLTSSILHALVHPSVEELYLNACAVTDDSIVDIGKCQQLHTLDINSRGKGCHYNNQSISTSALLGLFPKLNHLVVLHMKRCHAVTDEVLCAIADNCPQLSVLDVGGCTAVTDAGIKRLTEKLHFISSLNIADSLVTSQGILALAQGHCGTSLVELRVDGCKGVNNSAIEAIAKHCFGLKFLYFHECAVSEESWRLLDTLIINSKVQQLSWTVY